VSTSASTVQSLPHRLHLDTDPSENSLGFGRLDSSISREENSSVLYLTLPNSWISSVMSRFAPFPLFVSKIQTSFVLGTTKRRFKHFHIYGPYLVHSATGTPADSLSRCTAYTTKQYFHYLLQHCPIYGCFLSKCFLSWSI